MCRNFKFSLASIATVSACIFLFCLFFSMICNVHYIVKSAETNIGISVFFDESLSDEEIQKIGSQIGSRPEIKHMEYISAEDAWNRFKVEYFGDKQELAEGFADDNPLAGSASYTIYLNDLGQQSEFVNYLNGLDGVRQVNYSSAAISGLQNINQVISILSLAIIGVLLAVAVFLISNTISVAAAWHKKENEIMRLIGAGSTMIRAPFIIEGTTIGLVGAILPLVLIYFLYTYATNYITHRFGILSGLINFIPIQSIYPYMAGISAALAVGLGFIVSFFTIHKHLKV